MNDLTVLVVADDASQRCRTMDALAVQSVAPSFVLQTCWADALNDMASVSSTWVAILPDGAEPSPDWICLLDPHLVDPRVGCIGGRVLEFDGPSTSARWFGDEPRMAWIDSLGGMHSRFCDIPDMPQVRPVPFLRLDGAVVRTQDVSPSILAGLERWSRFEMAACFRARGQGKAVVFDSALVVCRPFGVGSHLPAPDDTDAWEAYGRSEIEALRLGPRGIASVWLTFRSLLIGSRVSPGWLLYPLYMTKPTRRSRWCAVTRGKARGLVGARAR